MFKKSSIKRLTIVLVALLVFMVALLAACSSATPFKQRTLPTHVDQDKIIGNGGIAVLYGEWLYYVNGNISNPASANNAYTEDLRSGAIVRIKLADLESHVLSVSELDMTSSEKTKEVEKQVRKYAEMVVPNVYYTGNTTSAALNGLYIFGDRIYITTPNDQLDSKGNVLSDQLVLASYNLGGGDKKTHLVFDSALAQLKLAQIDNSVYATYVLDGKLVSYKVGDNKSTTIAEGISSEQFSGDYVYYIDEDGAICQFKIGSASATVLVPMEESEGHEGHSHKSYSIQKVNNEYVYYTRSDNGSLDYPEVTGQVLFYANAPVTDDQHSVLIDAIPSGTYFCYGDKVVYTMNDDQAPDDQTRYKLVSTSGDGSELTQLLNERASLTLLQMQGNVLYYTMSSVTYTLNLAETDAEPIPYANGYSLSPNGWALPDVMTVGEGDSAVTYMFTLSTDSVAVVKFNPATKKNSTTTTYITLKAESDD